ncbi:hypothetical protein GCM10020219_054540 [Nonomuraea dietziae]
MDLQYPQQWAGKEGTYYWRTCNTSTDNYTYRKQVGLMSILFRQYRGYTPYRQPFDINSVLQDGYGQKRKAQFITALIRTYYRHEFSAGLKPKLNNLRFISRQGY